jgi:transcriptional regulator with XRE-family HTH domain
LEFADSKMHPEREVLSTVNREAGGRLRDMRLSQGLTLQRVEQLGAQIAAALNNQEFAIPMSRLSHIETKGVVPSIYRVHSLARIYRLTPETILQWYGIDQPRLDKLQLEESPRGRFALFRSPRQVHIPVSVDPSFDVRLSAEIGRMVEAWGDVPFSLLSRFQTRQFTYAYVGSEDRMMSPLLPPGSFVQIDPSRRAVKTGAWRNEYERPIYAIDSRRGLYLCWCSVVDRKMVLQPHPLSGQDVKIFGLDEMEVVGQVVAAAVRFIDASAPAVVPSS